MLPLVLALITSASDPITDLIDTEHAKLGSTECAGSCAAPVSYRVEDDDGPSADVTSKDRAFADDGTYCNVVGDKYCVSQPRLRLHAGLPASGSGGYVRMAPLLPHH
jgi:hypothetical protein